MDVLTAGCELASNYSSVQLNCPRIERFAAEGLQFVRLFTHRLFTEGLLASNFLTSLMPRDHRLFIACVIFSFVVILQAFQSLRVPYFVASLSSSQDRNRTESYLQDTFEALIEWTLHACLVCVGDVCYLVALAFFGLLLLSPKRILLAILLIGTYLSYLVWVEARSHVERSWLLQLLVELWTKIFPR